MYVTVSVAGHGANGLVVKYSFAISKAVLAVPGVRFPLGAFPFCRRDGALRRTRTALYFCICFAERLVQLGFIYGCVDAL